MKGGGCPGENCQQLGHRPGIGGGLGLGIGLAKWLPGLVTCRSLIPKKKRQEEKRKSGPSTQQFPRQNGHTWDQEEQRPVAGDIEGGAFFFFFKWLMRPRPRVTRTPEKRASCVSWDLLGFLFPSLGSQLFCRSGEQEWRKGADLHRNPEHLLGLDHSAIRSTWFVSNPLPTTHPSNWGGRLVST